MLLIKEAIQEKIQVLEVVRDQSLSSLTIVCQVAFGLF